MDFQRCFQMKKNVIRIFAVILAVLTVTIITYFDSFLYKNPIIRIEQTQTIKKDKSTDEYKNTDTQIEQKLTGVFLNTNKRKQRLTLKNTYYQSQLLDQKYHVGQQVILSKSGHHYSIKNVKRDTVIVFSLGLVIILLFCMQFSRGKLLISVLLNLLVYYGFVKLLIHNNTNLLLLMTVITSLLISGIALLIILGPNSDALMAYLSTVSATTLSILLSILLLKLSGNSGVHMELTDFGLQPYFSVFYSQVIFSVLGVILDETMDISSSLIEMKKEVNDVKEKVLFKAGINIGRELIGPLINILLFIVIAEHLNLILLYLSNGNSIGYTFTMTLSLGFAQLLISAIGIVLTVPITSFIASKIITRRAY
ncbi:integral membrane protein [Companilactobacillus tucceti DSM 20183]|uniref:Integral membrane protein n=2 Tax=Companilactobacillus tucceti TaxID=238012 RepID=A0A0R1J205_9LACO|nr:integral membrane protein [Companilactobacillus tucceti DSM 20183]